MMQDRRIAALRTPHRPVKVVQLTARAPPRARWWLWSCAWLSLASLSVGARAPAADLEGDPVQRRPRGGPAAALEIRRGGGRAASAIHDLMCVPEARDAILEQLGAARSADHFARHFAYLQRCYVTHCPGATFGWCNRIITKLVRFHLDICSSIAFALSKRCSTIYLGVCEMLQSHALPKSFEETCRRFWAGARGQAPRLTPVDGRGNASSRVGGRESAPRVARAPVDDHVPQVLDGGAYGDVEVHEDGELVGSVLSRPVTPTS